MARSDSFQAVPVALVPMVASASALTVIALALMAALVVTSFDDTQAVESANISIPASQRSIRVESRGSIAPEGVSDAIQGAQGLQETPTNLQQPTTSDSLQNAGGSSLNID